MLWKSLKFDLKSLMRAIVFPIHKLDTAKEQPAKAVLIVYKVHYQR
jgi:hypothetical protein